MADTKTRTRKSSSMSNEHKQALADGRTEASAVRQYLTAREAVKPKKGRKRTIENIRKELTGVTERLKEAVLVERLELLQRRTDLTKELADAESGVDIKPLEDVFVKVAKKYSSRKGITYTAWREYGVPPEVLKRAGISRGANGHVNGNGNGNASK